MVAGITTKSCVTLFPLQSLKKTVVGYIDVKQQETYEKLKNRGWFDIICNTDILLMLLLLIITMKIILLLVLLLLLLPLIKVIIIVIIITVM